MRGATLYLNDLLDERERQQRRRGRKAFAGAVAIALLGFGAAAVRGSKATPPIVVTTTVDRIGEVECSVMQRVEKEKRVIVVAPEPPPIPLLPSRGRQLDLLSAPPTRHLCVTPRR